MCFEIPWVKFYDIKSQKINAKNFICQEIQEAFSSSLICYLQIKIQENKLSISSGNTFDVRTSRPLSTVKCQMSCVKSGKVIRSITPEIF